MLHEKKQKVIYKNLGNINKKILRDREDCNKQNIATNIIKYKYKYKYFIILLYNI
jgi:hypothetical protein